MRKFKTTKKAMREDYGKSLFAVGYCELQYLLRFEEPFAYSAGANGWDCDYYELRIGGRTICVSTGYRPVGERIDYDLCKEFDDKARDIVYTYHSYDEQREKLAELIKEFVRRV